MFRLACITSPCFDPDRPHPVSPARDRLVPDPTRAGGISYGCTRNTWDIPYWVTRPTPAWKPTCHACAYTPFRYGCTWTHVPHAERKALDARRALVMKPRRKAQSRGATRDLRRPHAMRTGRVARGVCWKRSRQIRSNSRMGSCSCPNERRGARRLRTSPFSSLRATSRRLPWLRRGVQLVGQYRVPRVTTPSRV